MQNGKKKSKQKSHKVMWATIEASQSHCEFVGAYESAAKSKGDVKEAKIWIWSVIVMNYLSWENKMLHISN